MIKQKYNANEKLDITYYIYEETGNVTCVIRPTPKFIGYKLMQNVTVSGRAKCCAEDTFDVEKGKQIAYYRAIGKFKEQFNIIEGAANQVIRHTQSIINAAAYNIDYLHRKATALAIKANEA